MGPSIHQAERLDRRGRWFAALVLIVIIGLLISTWVGLFGFLGTQTIAGAVDGIEEEFVPTVGADDIDTFPNLSRLSQLYSADGVLLAELSERLSDPVPLDEIPDHVINAILASEDGDFYSHDGVDFQSTIRAAIEVFRGGNIQGGSTITQQVVRQQNYVGNERTVVRKIAEARFASELENRYTKDQILEFYLNSVYFGANAYGINAAAREYFGKELEELTIAEAAAISTTIRNPSLYNPRRRPELVKDRRDIVLDLMAGEGFISAEAAEGEKERPLGVVPHVDFEEPAPALRIEVVRQLLNNPEFAVLGATPEQRKIAIFGCPAEDEGCEDRPGLKGGLKIVSTLDFAEQERANELLRTWLPQPEDGTKAPTGAIVTVDNNTGAVIVMAGGLEFGTDFEAGERDYNLAVEGARQPGSSFKPFALVAYLEQGGSMNSYWNWTHPLPLQCGFPCGPGGSNTWKVGNASGSGSGIRSLFSATVGSVNTVYAQIALEVGPEAIADVANRMGVSAELPPVYSLALGSGEVSPLDMAAGYSTLANYGVKLSPYMVERIEDTNGNVLYEHQSTPERVLDETLAGVVVEAMRAVVNSGTGTAARLPDRQVAGKTGTNQSFRDAWFVGFVPQYSTAVWVGYADDQTSLRNVTINDSFYSRVFGGSVPAPIWRQYMTALLEGVPAQDFPPIPGGGSQYKITPSTQVPDVIALPEREATQKVYFAHLGVAIEEINSLEPEGTVVEQEPEGGAKLSHGNSVTLRISNGLPPTVPLPNFQGMTLTEASNEIGRIFAETNVLLSLAPPVFEEQDNPDVWNRVVRSDPGPGVEVDGTSPIVLVFGKAPEPAEPAETSAP